jgi:L-arabinonolactonase
MPIGASSVRALGGFRAVLGESPVWCPETERVLWLDIGRSLLLRTDPVTGQTETQSLPARPGMVGLAGGGVVLTLGTGIWLLSPGDRWRLLAPSPHPGARTNDGAVDPAGRLWFSTMAQAGGDGRIHCLAGGDLTADVVTGLGTPNGIAFSPDGGRMYFSDSKAESQGVWVFDYDIATSSLSGRRLFFDPRGKTGRPDGATVDAAGRYWFAAVEGSEIVCLTPDGSVDGRIALPVSRPTKPVFGGAALDRLFVTSIAVEGEPMSGALFAIPAERFEGRPAPRFNAQGISAP